MLVVEDDPAQQVLLRTALDNRGFATSVASSGAEAVRSVAVQVPEVIVLDLGLGDVDGIDLCRRFRATTRSVIIVATADTDERRMVQALELGADDYVTKPYSIDVLVARVRVGLRHVAALGASEHATTYTVGDLLVDVPGHNATADGRVLELSPRLFRLLTAFVRNPGALLTHKQLALATNAAGDTGAGLRNGVSLLRKELGEGPARPRIDTEPHVGYRMVAPD